MLPAFIFIIGGLLTPLFKDIARKIYLVLVSLAGLIVVFSIKAGTVITINFLDFQLILLKADKLSLFVAYIFVIIGLFAVIYSLHIKESIFQLLGFCYLGSALGLVFAGDFLTLYIFWELVAVSSTGLILLNKDPEARNAGFRYIIMHLIGGLFLLGGIWLHYLNTGSLEIVRLAAGLPLYLVIVGAGINSGFMFLHTWLPDSYPKAPYYSSIFMSVFTTKTAVYLLARVAPGWSYIAYIGAAMAIFGVTMALMQNNTRKLLSYHIISQVGYMVAAIGIGTAVGINGAMYHLFNNILYKTALFMASGAVIYTLGKENLHEMGGLAKKMPFTTASVIIASLSITGIPFFNGFISKGLIFDAAHSNDYLYLMLELAAVGTFLSFLKFSYYGFLRPNPELEKKAVEAPWNMTVPMIGLAVLCFITGIFPGLVTRILPFANDVEFFTFDHFFGVSQLFIVITAVFVIGRVKVFAPHNRQTFDFDVAYVWTIEKLAVIPATFSLLNNWLESVLERIPVVISKAKQPAIIFTNYLSDFFTSIWIDFWLFSPVSDLNKTELEPNKKLAPALNQFFFIPFNWFISVLGNVGNKIATKATEIEAKYLNKGIQYLASFVWCIEELALGKDSAFSKRLDNMTNTIAGKMAKVEKDVIDKGSQEVMANLLWNIEELTPGGNKISSLSNRMDRIVIDGFINIIPAAIIYIGERVRRVQTGLVQNYALVVIFIVSVLIIMFSLKGGF